MIQACGEPIKVERRDPGVGHDRAINARRNPVDFCARLIENAWADQNRIGARGQWNFHSAPRPWQRSSTIAQRRIEAPEDGVDNRIVGGVNRFDSEIGERIGRRALFQQPTQRHFWVGGLQQRPIGLLAHPGKQNVKTRLQPNRETMPGNIVAGGRIHERAAAGRQDQRSAFEQAGDHLALALPEISLAEPLEDLGNGQLGAGFDLRIGVDERQSKLCRQPFANRGFSGPHHADENHRAPAERRRHLPGVNRLALAHEPLTSPATRVRASHTRGRRRTRGRRSRFAMSSASVLRAAPVLATMSTAREQVRSGRRRRRQDARRGNN